MVTHRLETSIWLPRAPDEVFGFFADAGNLQEITPGWLRFDLVTPLPIVMAAGTLLEYRIRLHGLPVRWRSEITVWDPPRAFVDEQRHGPYRAWRHLHTFSEESGGTRVGDRVDYAVPGGRLVHELFVKADLRRIFHYRHHYLQRRFGAPADDLPSIAITAVTR